jgi:glycosyltransferase involved in cell wall biosynthesis
MECHIKRRVLILSEIIAPYRIPVFNALAKNEGVDLHVVFLSETDAGLRQWRVYKDEIRFSYEVLPSWRFRTGKHKLLLNWGLRSRLKKFAPEAIICGGYNYFASWEALSWTRRHQAELILWSESNSRDTRRGHAWVESLKARFLAGCDRFVVPGRASREYLQSLGSALENIVTAPNAVDNDWFRIQADSIRDHVSEFRARYGLPARYLLFVGRLVPEKGVFDLLNGYAKLEGDLRSKVGLVFAGDGPCLTELQRQARRINPGTACFPGFVHREDLAGLYAFGEALILPTHSDPWGLVVNEGMACGLPVIVSSVAGCAVDLVEDGWNGYIVPPRDGEKLSVAIDSVLRNPALRQQMSLRSLERIRDYSPEACAQGLAAAAISFAGQAR